MSPEIIKAQYEMLQQTFGPRIALNAQEACQLLGVGKTKLYDLAKQERIPYFMMGTQKMFSIPQLLEFMFAGGTPDEEKALKNIIAKASNKKVTVGASSQGWRK